MSQFIFRRAQSNEGSKLKEFFNQIFLPEKVGDLAEIIFQHLPGMNQNNWFVAEDSENAQIASAFALIPWQWQLEGIDLKVAEMGIVGTNEKYRGMGLQKQLNKDFDKEMLDEGFDLAVIQGIPGFYNKFGYHYSVALENHINLPLDAINNKESAFGIDVRKATEADIPFLMHESYKNNKHYSVSVVRDEEKWRYLFGHSRQTECISDFWIVENQLMHKKYYLRVSHNGFGKGLILSETSEEIDEASMLTMFQFCKKLAIERNKPYIRINMHNDSNTSRIALSMGAVIGRPYAWQVKIPNKLSLLHKLKPLLEKRMASSTFLNFSGTFRFDLYQESIDLHWKDGSLVSVVLASENECEHTFCINSDLFASLILGHRSWREIQYLRPDCFPATQYLSPAIDNTDKAGDIVDAIFPATRSWVYLQY